ncbi:flagellar biosynthetic protein FliO, partial [Erwinia amylovora]|uniref:flagellar biosynthetic protein FliO n=1 Tax=Erwinia amylovora TaxID=552 RepID=UPI00200B119C
MILILARARLATRVGIRARRNGSPQLNIRASCQRGQRERVVIDDFDDARRVLGFTAHQETHLHTQPPKQLEYVPEHTIAPA